MILVVGVAVLVGAVVQRVVGFGLALVAAPVLTLAAPRLMPGALLLLTASMPVLSVYQERRHVDWRGLKWALIGRLPGIAVGTAAVVALPSRVLGLIVAVAVLGAVGLSLVSWRPMPTPRALLAAGFVSGITGTATSIGGPPVAILYQHSSGPRIRATLAMFFLVGALLSAGALAAAGRMGGREVTAAATLLPFLLVGFALSGPLRRHVDRGRMRLAVLVVAGVSAVVLALRAVLG